MGVEMAIVTISRDSASGGLLLAEGLAAKLGYDIVRREEIIHDAAKAGVPEEKLENALLEPPGLWEKLKHDRRRYLIFIQQALCERALRDNIIYLGNAGHLLLGSVSHVLCILLIAPLAFRVRMLVNRERITTAEAISRIESADRQRRDWTRLLYGVDSLDPHLYDLTINLKTMRMESAVELAVTAVNRSEFFSGEESRRAIADLSLSTRVKAALASAAASAAAEVEVKADAATGLVLLKGRVRPASMVQALVEVAQKVQGVSKVDRDFAVNPDHRV